MVRGCRGLLDVFNMTHVWDIVSDIVWDIVRDIVWDIVWDGLNVDVIVVPDDLISSLTSNLFHRCPPSFLLQSKTI